MKVFAHVSPHHDAASAPPVSRRHAFTSTTPHELAHRSALFRENRLSSVNNRSAILLLSTTDVPAPIAVFEDDVELHVNISPAVARRRLTDELLVVRSRAD